MIDLSHRDPHDQPAPMSGATLRVTRERLGLTTRWLAEHLDVAERTVHRWENEHSTIPPGVRRAVEHLAEETEQMVAENVAELLGTDRAVVETYRTDEHLARHRPDASWPASWHRALVGRLALEVPGLGIVYADDQPAHDDDAPTRYATRDEAILREIVEPIEAGDASADDYDVDAIADEALADYEGGYALRVDVEEFWQIVERHAR